MADATSATAAAAVGGTRGASRLGLFLRSSVFDYLLVLAVSTGLVFTVSYGFYSAPDLRGNVALEAGVCAVLLAILYAGSWSKRAVAFSAIGYVVAAVAVIGAFAALSPGSPPMFADGQVNDVEENYAVFAMVLVIVPVVVYLLSRRPVGVVVLFLLGALACGTIQFLYRDWMAEQPGALAALLVYIGMGALFVTQGYRQGVLASHHAKKTSFFGAFAFGVVASALCALVAAGLFFGIVAGLGLETANIKPFQDYYQRPVIEYEGVYDLQSVDNPDETTDDLNENMEDSNENAEDSGEDDSEGGGFSAVSVIVNTFNPDNWNSVFEAVSFNVPLSLRFLIVFVPVAIVALVVGLRLYVRKRRLRKISSWPAAERVVYLYDFFMKRFKRLKVDRAASLTPLEFALSASGELAPFARNASNTDFLTVTLLYQRAAFGLRPVEDDEYQLVEDYYNAFFKTAHRQTGHLKWAFWRFWRI